MSPLSSKGNVKSENNLLSFCSFSSYPQYSYISESVLSDHQVVMQDSEDADVESYLQGMEILRNDLKALLSSNFTEGKGVWLNVTDWLAVLKSPHPAQKCCWGRLGHGWSGSARVSGYCAAVPHTEPHHSSPRSHLPASTFFPL